MDAAVNQALGGVLQSKTPREIIRRDANYFSPPPPRVFRAFSLTLVLPLILTAFLLSCGPGAGGVIETEDEDPYIEMTVANASVTIGLAGTGNAVISWGGVEETVTLSASLEDFTNQGSLTPPAVIRVTAADGITQFECYDSGVTRLDVSNNAALTYLDCSENALTALDITKNTALRTLYCNYTDLTSLDITKNTLLETLYCGITGISSLDLSGNPELLDLNFESAELTELNVSANVKLKSLNFLSNGLTSLDLTPLTGLEELDCQSNHFTKEALEALFTSLHGNEVPNKDIYCQGNPGSAECNESIAEDKGWEVHNADQS